MEEAPDHQQHQVPPVRFQFQPVADLIGKDPLRPLIKVRLHSAALSTGEWCLLVTGTVDTSLDWEAAYRMGLNPESGEAVSIPSGFTIGGAKVEEVRGFTLDGFIENDGRFIRLRNCPVLFVRPWSHEGFTGVWGTR